MRDGSERVPDGPSISEGTWFSAALAAGVVTIVLVCGAAAWVFSSADEPSLMVQRAQAFTPFGAAMLAVVTFFTVAWRGVVNAKQLAANEYASQAGFLIEGAKILAQPDRQPDAEAAALAALSIPLNDPTPGRHQQEALDQVAAFYCDKHGSNMSAVEYDKMRRQRNVRTAERLLRDAARRDLKTNVDWSISSTSNPGPRWRPQGVFRFPQWDGGSFDRAGIAELNGFNRDAFWITKAKILQAHLIIGEFNYNECTFIRCHFHRINLPAFVSLLNYFDHCCFSGCQIVDTDEFQLEFPDLRDQGCWFDPSNPPLGVPNFDWERVLLAQADHPKP